MNSRGFVLGFAVIAALLAGSHGVFSGLDPSPISGVRSRTPIPEQALSAAAFVDSIGVNAHLSYLDTAYGNFPRVEDRLRTIGIRHVREGVHLGSKDYDELLFGRWIALGKIGIRFDAVLDPRENLGPLTPALIGHIEQLAGGTIESYEGPNELDINMRDWVHVDRYFQKSIFSAVESANLGTRPRVIAPSLASAANGRAFDGSLTGFDEGNLHPYPAGRMPSIIFPKQTDLARKVFGNKPIVITESGYHNALKDYTDQPGVSEQAAAKYIPRLFLENFSHHIARTYLYELFDEKSDPDLRDNQLHWGLLRADGSEKPAYLALKNLIGELDDSANPTQPLELSWTLIDSGPAIHHLLLKKSNGRFDLILWQEVSSYNTWMHRDIDNRTADTTLLLGKQARRITLFEPVLQPAPLRTYANTTSVPVSIPDHPLVVEIEMK